MFDDKRSSTEHKATRPRVGQLAYVRKVLLGRWVAVAGLIIIAILIVVAIFAPLIAPYNPYQQNLKAILMQPSASHLLGTDELGRDLLSRIIYGSRISLLVGIVGVSIAGAIGILLGLIAGYFGKWINGVIMRFIDTLLSIPPLVLMLAIAAILGGGLFNVLIAIGVGMMPTYCRLMCAQVISLNQSDYITAARSMGASDLRIMFRHLLVNAFPPILVLITMNLGTAILTEASLSFLGIGILPPTPTWGAMINRGKEFLLTNPINSFAPGIAILLVVLSFNMVGDGIRDALDPKLRGIL